MADVATKNKSMNVVSNNTVNSLGKTKMSDVCGVQSNNGLIDLDHNGLNKTSNNKLITMCSTIDDEEEENDLILANNTRNELDSQEDKSLQELIESELALRICATSRNSNDEDEPSELVMLQPEITKKIILEPRQDAINVNTEFIVNEIEHYTLIGESYEYSNGYMNPDPNEISKIIKLPELHDNNETLNPDVTMTTSRPSLSLAFEAIQNQKENDTEIQNQHLEEDQITSLNTLSDFCIVEETTDEDSSKELNHQSIISADKYFQKEELLQSNDNTNLFFIEEQLQMNNDSNHEDIQDNIEDDNMTSMNEIVYDECDIKLEKNLIKPGKVLPKYIFIENESNSNLMSILQDKQNNVDSVEETFDQNELISLKEASGVDEKACSFYSTETEGSENCVNNDKNLENSICSQSTINVTNYKLKVDFSKQEERWMTVEEVVKDSTVDIIITQGDESLHERMNEGNENFYSQESHFENYLEKSKLEDENKELAPLATPDEISDISNACDDSESLEEIITTGSGVNTTTKKKKKIEGITRSDALPNHTKTKKNKKSKKSELEKENISVKKKIKSKETKESMHTGSRQASAEMFEISGEDDLSNVNVKSLTQTYVSETNRVDPEKLNKEIIATGVSIKQLCRSFGDISNMSEGERTTLNPSNTNKFQKSSFNKFDALSKKSSQVLHVRSVDAGKVQQQLNSLGQNGDANQNCRSCGKVVFQMEQTKAEGLVWHKNCFRCIQCGKQLNVDNYESHEATLYCKPHFKELFLPKPVEETDQPTSNKPDLGLEELSSLNVKSRFQVFEKANETTNDIERSPSQIAVKRSPSILSKLAKFQAKGMDIGVADESLNGIPYEESTESEEEIEEEATEDVEESNIVKSKRRNRERPISFRKMDDIKNRWETTSQQGKRETQREARKEEIAGIRSRLFMGKQGKMKEMYQQAVADSERVTKINAAEEIQHTTNARSIKERFERGESIAAISDNEQENGSSKLRGEKPNEEILAAGISRKSRSLFMELDATAAKTGRPVTPNSQGKILMEAPRRARDMDSPDREIYRDPDVVRAEDRAEDVVHTDTARKMLSIFRQMEENASKEDLPNGPKPLKRFTPPPEDKFAKATASESDEEEEEAEESEDEEQNPNYVRASDKVEDEFLKQAQNAARAKTLRAKFEQWETTDGKTTNHHVAEMDIAPTDGTQPNIESASSLRARFESLGSQPIESPRSAKVKVNRFV